MTTVVCEMISYFTTSTMCIRILTCCTILITLYAITTKSIISFKYFLHRKLIVFYHNVVLIEYHKKLNSKNFRNSINFNAF